MNDEWPGDPVGLNEADSAAFEALIDAGFDVQAVAPPMRARASRVAAVLGLLDAPHAVGDAEAMTDATLTRIRLLETDAAASRLSGNDEDALEALVSAGFASEAVPAVLRRRAARQEQLLNLLEPAAAEIAGDGTLMQRTLARVQESIDRQEERLKAEPASFGTRRMRMADLLTVAALLLIAGAAIGPMVGAMRAQSQRLACQSGLQAAGLGFASYANDFKDSMPMASASIAGTPWWYVGRPEQSNSANFYTLTRTGYTKLTDLACPGVPGACRDDRGPGERDWHSLDEVSYSYQNLFGRSRTRLTTGAGPGSVVVVVDASPVVRRAVRGLWINPLANSQNHAGKGQNALLNDGRVQWLTSPVTQDGDNIWLPRFLEEAIAKARQSTQAEPIKGTETPTGPDDEFVGP